MDMRKPVFKNPIIYKVGLLMIRCRLASALVIAAFATLLAAAASQRAPGRDPAPDFSRPISAEKAPDADGFIQRWLILEPIPVPIRSNAQLNDGFVQTTIKTEYFPGQYTVIPRDGDKVMVNGAELMWHAVDTSAYHVNLYHFAYALNKPTFNIVFWAVTIVNCPEEMRNVRLAVGSNAASIWWVNGREVIDIYGDRHMIVDDGVSQRLSLKKGPNVVRCAVINSPGVSDICARFLDAEDTPVKSFMIDLGAGVK
jgi:hypothetical protein